MTAGCPRPGLTPVPPPAQISLVSQEPVLFARSITDNISYGLPALPFEKVVEAAQKANAHDFIKELQDGYDTGTPRRRQRHPRAAASRSRCPPPAPLSYSG